MKISDVLRKTGLSRNTVGLMYKETAQKIDIEALDKLCRLFECEVADILEFVNQSNEAPCKEGHTLGSSND